MTDPYKVLDVSPSASDEEIRTAYRELAKKYHPDNYNASPLADLAQEKMQEINAAYDAIVSERRNGTPRSAPYGSAGGGYSGAQSRLMHVRSMIQARRLTEAEEALDAVPPSDRDAEWDFLRGSVYYARGWLSEAYNYFASAANRNPANPEYRAALNQLNWQRQGNMAGAPPGYNTRQGGSDCTGCDMCSGLICADCCCECAGGDLIPCC